MTTLILSPEPGAELDCDVLVLGAVPAEAESPAATLVPADGLPEQAREHVEDQLAALRFGAALEKTVVLARVPGIAAPRVVVVGLGATEQSGSPENLRLACGAALMTVTDAEHVGLLLPLADASAAAAAAEGAALGAYRFTKQRGAAATPPVLTERITVLADGEGFEDAVRRAGVRARWVAYARDLVNASPNLLYPQTFADSVAQHASGLDVRVEVLDDEQLRAGGYGGITGVGQGSAHKPRLVTMTYAPQGASSHLALVGKGITFDSGGLDIKPADGMAGMKSDMAGAAAVAATVLAAAELGLPVAVTGLLGLAENMPSSTAQRASDVVTVRNGTTVEVTNTDAEGRMVLADVMTQAAAARPDALIDIATLTGHQVVALGNEIAAVMGNDDAFRARVCAAAGEAGEQVWAMPLPKALRAELDSPSADLRHKGGRPGGMLTAGIFLQEFVPVKGDETGSKTEGERVPWAHIDIAGPSFNEAGTRGFTPKGGTGFGVTTMLAVAEDLAANGI